MIKNQNNSPKIREGTAFNGGDNSNNALIKTNYANTSNQANDNANSPNAKKSSNNSSNTNNNDGNNTTQKVTKKQTLRKFLVYLKPHSWLIILAVIFSLIQVAAQLLAPVFIGRAIDYMTEAGAVVFDKVFYYVVALIVTVAMVLIFQYLMNVLAGIAAHKTIADMRADTFVKLNRMPLKTLDGLSQGDLIHRVVNDADRIADGLVQGFTNMFSGVVLIIGTIALMFRLNLFIAIIVILLTPLSILVAYLIAKFSQRMFARQVKAEGRLSGHIEEHITNQRLVKLFGFEQRAENKFDEINGEIKFAGERAVFYSALINPFSRILNGLVYCAVCLAGALLVIKANNAGTDALTVGGLSMFLAYALQYSKPFNEISSIVTEMQVALVSAARLIEILEKPKESDDSMLPSLVVEKGDVCFNNVDFSYTDAPFIKGFSLSALQGQHIAIVGRTGCGKTTILSLLMRFYDITDGQITIDQADTAGHKRSSVRTNIGMVLQDTWLFKGTVRENIAYGKENATDEEIVAAAKKARIDGFIRNLSQGYDTVLESYSLSQGQMQLLCIARVFLALPKIIILDEATSNIDARTEVKIQQAFKDITSGHTSFIVAHRLSTIKNADIILVMDAGSIVESGTHSELFDKKGWYYSMISALENT